MGNSMKENQIYAAYILSMVRQITHEAFKLTMYDDDPVGTLVSLPGTNEYEFTHEDFVDQQANKIWEAVLDYVRVTKAEADDT
mgnify:CR=1 FL=1